MAEEFDWLTLEEDESVLWSSGPHKVSFYSGLVIGIPLCIVLIGIPIVIWSWLWYNNTDYVVTDKRIYAKRGVVSRNVKTIDFDKVQNINYRQSAMGAQFGYGTVEISTAGSSGAEVEFRSIPDPADVQDLVDREIKRDRGRSDDGRSSKQDVLDEIVTELRAIRGLLEDASGQTASAGTDRRSDTGGSTRGSSQQVDQEHRRDDRGR